MIPLPGLELLILMLRITVGLTVAAVLLAVILVSRAHGQWSDKRPALGEHRVAFGSVVWAFVWVLLHLPDRSTLFALLPLSICASVFWYIAAGNRRRGHENPRLLRPGLTALALAIVTLFLVGFGIRLRTDAIAREQAARAAEGRRDQDWFQALARPGDSTIAVIGTTSTRPHDADDVWVYTLDVEGRLLGSKSFTRSGDQLGLTLAIGPGDTWILGGQDEDHPFLAVATPDSIVRHHRWDTLGALSVLLPAGDGRFLLGGRSGDSAWIGLVDRTGREVWRRELDAQVDYPQVNALVLVGDWFFAAGSDFLFSHGAFLVGGTLDGHIDWVRPFRAGPGAICELTDLCVKSDGTILALGSRGSRDRLEDLWLAHVSRDGTVLDESTFGDTPIELPGGFALRGEELIVVGHRFPGIGSELWMRAMDAHGAVRWEKTYPESGFGRASDVALLPGGDIVLAGGRTLESKRDAWIARFDREGTLVWQKTFPTSR